MLLASDVQAGIVVDGRGASQGLVTADDDRRADARAADPRRRAHGRDPADRRLGRRPPRRARRPDRPAPRPRGRRGRRRVRRSRSALSIWLVRRRAWPGRSCSRSRRPVHDPEPRPVRGARPGHRPVDPDRRDPADALHAADLRPQHPRRLRRGARATSSRPPTGWATRRRERLRRVELPLALPLVVGGLRLASVSTIGLVTISGILGDRFGGPRLLHLRGLPAQLPDRDLVRRHSRRSSSRSWPTCAAVAPAPAHAVARGRAADRPRRARRGAAAACRHEPRSSATHRLARRSRALGRRRRASRTGSLEHVALSGVVAGHRGGDRAPDRALDRPHRPRRRRSSVNLANIGRALPSLAVIAHRAADHRRHRPAGRVQGLPDAHRDGRARDPADPRQHADGHRAGSTATSSRPAAAMGMREGQVLPRRRAAARRCRRSSAAFGPRPSRSSRRRRSARSSAVGGLGRYLVEGIAQRERRHDLRRRRPRRRAGARWSRARSSLLQRVIRSPGLARMERVEGRRRRRLTARLSRPAVAAGPQKSNRS